ncbi:von Willebrand factor A domain-containing protein 7-like [Astyanax mexicanus]|uniref:von Willebrand factor A domain-containing protein 7-like n=1 Tax=Astyanax mexicanus TaxID=7994 RepID=A0A8B9LSC8_ASTMX|nr:von Willebrand factor A domain-containing protein 7-like [Astyanax mexicanus]
MWSAVCVITLGVLLSRAQAFLPVGTKGNTHVTITKNAVMKKINEVCKAEAVSAGRTFNPTGSSVEEILRACLGTSTGTVSAAKFHEALNQIYLQNSLVDRDFMSSDPHHFNSETFIQGRTLITQGMATVKINIRKENFQAAREALGRVLHTLQDFYSHSNWVELGNKKTYPNLLRRDLTIDNVAAPNMATCRDCASGTCPNQLTSTILRRKKLTSGYINLTSSNKPKGKCSHGGATDLSSKQMPRGGISKDELLSHNAELHKAAVALATQASVELLDNIVAAVGNQEYLRFMGITRSVILCFVIDTTGSMADDIAEAKRVAHNIIDSKKGTPDEPSEYILVPFNDPDFGPVIRTTDPNKMKAEISKLGAVGGGDTPEMCMSGLQLALTAAPTSSEIYVFTDAPAKDTHLEKTVFALIASTKSTVNFFKTSGTRSRRSTGSSDFELYSNLALASGGQAIRVSKAELPKATDIIIDTSTSALVTILQRARKTGSVESFSFLLDSSLSKVTAYITGDSLKFTLKSPSGVSQSNSVASGSLAKIQTVGNLWRLQFNSATETGLWTINMDSKAAYNIKVTGQSPITFVYNFVEEFKGPHPGFAVIEGRPQTGLPTKLLLTATSQKGAEALTVKEIALVEVSGSQVVDGKIQEMGGGDFLVSVDKIPAGEFVVMMKGEEKASSSKFQRQSTTQMSLSKITVKATVDSTLVPGESFKLPFTVKTSGKSGTYTISARNDKGFPLVYSTSVSLVTGVSAAGTVVVKPPANTESGTDITLTIAAEAPGGFDSNYAILHLTVLAKVTDFTPPVCEITGVNSACPSDCTKSNWDVAFNITDGNGTGIENIFIQEGKGSLTQKTVVEGGITVVKGNFTSSCCSPNVTISIVDKEGNVGKCTHSIEEEEEEEEGEENKEGGLAFRLFLSLQAWIKP